MTKFTGSTPDERKSNCEIRPPSCPANVHYFALCHLTGRKGITQRTRNNSIIKLGPERGVRLGGEGVLFEGDAVVDLGGVARVEEIEGGAVLHLLRVGEEEELAAVGEADGADGRVRLDRAQLRTRLRVPQLAAVVTAARYQSSRVPRNVQVPNDTVVALKVFNINIKPILYALSSNITGFHIFFASYFRHDDR